MTRYDRQALLPGWGEPGQARLASAHALIVGCGALGCIAADLLARAGVGHLTLVDRDIVERSNLPRQALFSEDDLGAPKALAARDRLARINSSLSIDAHAIDLTHANARAVRREAIPEGAPGILLDGSDTFETRFLLNDLAVAHALPYFYAGVLAARATAFPILPGGPCLRCLLPEPPPHAETCETAGVFAPAVWIIAAAQAGEALKLLLGLDDRLARSILSFDLWSNDRRRLPLPPPDPQCPCCASRRFDFLDGALAPEAVRLCGRSGIQISPPTPPSPPPPLDLDALAARLSPHAPIARWEGMIRLTLAHERGDDPAQPIQVCLFADGRALILGTTSIPRARSILARLLG